jgi:outer membrane protein OmpA-like peptidoglycan-associated protein
VTWIIVLGLLGGGIWFGRPYFSKLIPSNPATPAPNHTSVTPPTPAPPGPKLTTPKPVVTPTPEPEIVAAITRPERIDLDLAKRENKQAQDEVLRRIDLMPTISPTNKDKLYASVHRARSMGLVLTIPFAAGKTTLTPPELLELKTELEKPEIMNLRDDPTAVFVVLGYADSTGDEHKNLDISQRRADSVLEAMRDKCTVANVMHSVAMGGQKLLDARSLERNRVVEVWAVLP